MADRFTTGRLKALCLSYLANNSIFNGVLIYIPLKFAFLYTYRKGYPCVVSDFQNLYPAR